MPHPAVEAAEYQRRIGLDITLADGFDEEFLADAPAEDEAAERQAHNQRFGEWMGMY